MLLGIRVVFAGCFNAEIETGLHKTNAIAHRTHPYATTGHFFVRVKLGCVWRAGSMAIPKPVTDSDARTCGTWLEFTYHLSSSLPAAQSTPAQRSLVGSVISSQSPNSNMQWQKRDDTEVQMQRNLRSSPEYPNPQITRFKLDLCFEIWSVDDS